jgi:3-deoxy-manno-octulosonate cytidylyltransferase (CMP-KDO synthetase)
VNRPGHANSGATRSGAVIAVIPARFASKRFPGKLLADRTGKPLIQHVHERVSAARCINRILIAADDRRIIEAVRDFGGDAVMTRADHANGTSRIAEVAVGLDCEFIVNVQGDEPELDPALIDLAVQHLRERSECPVGTLASPFASDEDPRNPNIVKVVRDSNGRALYFSRSLIPFDRDGSGTALPLKHVGLYVYRREFLPRYVALPPTPLEQAEQLEQLRVLEHGFPIAVVVAQVGHHGIDTPQQYEQFVQRQREAASLARR